MSKGRAGGVMAFLSSSASSSSASKSTTSISKNASDSGKGVGSGKSGHSTSGRGFFGSSRSSSCSGGKGASSGGGSGSGGGNAKGSDVGAGDYVGDSLAAAHDYYGGLLEMDENDNSFPWGLIHHSELASMLTNGLGKTMVIDSRSFLEYNTSNIQQSVNVCCSKLVKRRLQQDKVHVVDLLNQTCNVVADSSCDVIVYDQCTEDPSLLTADNFVHVLLRKLSTTFNSVAFLKGGFLTFQASHSNLVENKSSRYQCSTLTSLSQPCMPVSNVGPTRILSFLYLGSQLNSMAHDVAQVNGITYILNVSKTCPRPPFILEGHFHRIPVSDNYCEKLLPYFPEAFQFLDKVREANGCVLVHCLGGVSRSATLAIAYIMKHMRMSSDEAYRYVKDKRPTISPNFNFLGQLLEYEKIVRQEEAKEAARMETLRAGKNMDEDCLSEAVGRASPSVMDLHTSSPSSPGPRTANRTLSPLTDSSPSTAPLPSSAMECPFPGPESPDKVAFPSSSYNLPSSIPSPGPSPLTTGSKYFPALGGKDSASQSHHRIGSMAAIVHQSRPELCPFPGPSYANPAYVHNPDLNPSPAGETNLQTSNPHADTPYAKGVHQMQLHPMWDKPTTPQFHSSFPNVPSDLSPASTCPVTGFPSPGDGGNDQPQSTTHPKTLSSPFPNASSLDDALETCSTYQSEAADISQMLSPTSSDSTLSSFPTKLGQSKSKPSFLSSVFSGFRRRSRPPTLSLGSPVLHSKGSFSSLGEKVLGPQLTPVSEASENCDLILSENISDNNVSCVSQTNRSESIDNRVPTSSPVDPVSPSPFAQLESPLSAQAPALPSPSNESLSSKNVKTVSPKMRSVKLNPRNFFLSLSSPSSDFNMSSSMPCLSALPASTSSVPSAILTRQILHSPGDSNKRKSGIQFHHFNSPDKLARTEDFSPTSSKSALAQSPFGGKTRHRPSIKKPTFLTLSSPTTAMARLNFSSPSNPSKDFPQTLAAAVDQGRFGSDNNSPMSGLNVRQETALNDDVISGQSDSHAMDSVESKDKLTQTRSGPDHALTKANLSLLASSLPLEPSGELSHSSTSCFSASGSTGLDLSSSSVSSSYLNDGGAVSSSSMSSSVLSSSMSSSSMHYQSLSKFPTTSLDKLSFTPCSVRDIVQDLKDRDSNSKTEDQCSSLLTDSHASSSALDSPMSISSGSSAPSIASSTLSPVEASSAPHFPSAVPERSDSIEDDIRLEVHDTMEQQADDSMTDSGVHSASQPPLPSPSLDSSAAVTPDSMLSPLSSLPQSSISPVVPSLTSPCDSFCSSTEPLSPMSLDDSALNSPLCSPDENRVLSQNLTSLTSTHSSICSPIMSYSVISPVSSTSSLAVSSSSSSLALSSSTAAAPSSTKVILRKDKNRRVLDRPNSIAFSSYPTCNLIPEAAENAANGATPSHHDDTSSAIASGLARRSRSSLSPDFPYHRGRTSWGCYSEREVYRQITAAMESAMLRTQAYLPHHQSSFSGGRDLDPGASRKARSLDNIIDKGEEDFFTKGSVDGSGKVEDSGSHFRGKYKHEKAMLLDPYHCGRHGGPEPYHSSSSLSSNGSHSSIHSSLEIIQVS